MHACTAPQNLNLNIDLHVCIQLCWVQIIDFSIISQFGFMNRISKVLARCLKHFTCFESTVSIVTTHCIVQVNFHNICTFVHVQLLCMWLHPLLYHVFM